MVHFIDLEDLRAKVLENTRQLVLLMNERMELARHIAEIKGDHGMQIRDPVREALVRQELKTDNPLLNLIFEATIVEQVGGIKLDDPIQLSGTRDSLMFILGLFICRPGLEVHSKNVPESFIKGCSVSGGHFVDGDSACGMLIDIGSGFPVRLTDKSMTIFPDALDMRNKNNILRVRL
ncbi:hypothetical protein DMB44_01275 [Thermoplasma sp. Kam2015]|uniref:chorismate mutase n=1 Tax=Thermoplasma sp. Kam2015 TaxID=2094122 RepID=UPI000D9B8A3A|nr:chorismate mutase [Thermoplasma sp. Kam2015]PYB68960.1 hypothetical protein DMB44_01275 [Thermoplasma sp. Kam2015]